MFVLYILSMSTKTKEHEMTMTQNEYNNLMKSANTLALNIKKEIYNVSKSIEVINTYLTKSMNMDIDLLPDEGVKKLNEDLNHILFLQDMLINDVKLIAPTATQLADQTYWMKDKIYWMTEISDRTF